MNEASNEAAYAAAKRQMLPPVAFLIALIAMFALHWFAPVATMVPAPYNLIGIVFVVAGLLGAIVASNRFRRAGTPVRPFERSTTLVTAGLNRYTRNPMYLGLVLMLVGAGVGLGTLAPFLVVVVFVWWIQTRYILREEAFLEGIFGQEYLAYKARVRRWL